MDIELIINEDYLQTRQFNYLTNLKNEQNLNCSFKYIFENKEMIVGRHLKNENNFIFYNIPNELINEGEMGGNKKYSEAEFIIELPSYSILQKYISVPQNQVLYRRFIPNNSSNSFQISLLTELNLNNENIQNKIIIYERMYLENIWQEIYLTDKKLELIEKLNKSEPKKLNELKHKFINEIKNCYEKVVNTDSSTNAIFKGKCLFFS
uniref:Uncharacterized protein n=1 Tax=Meloidogyne enterolobii TaxID=390850 RepID=A0A6V7WK44_MELEN|nr:unnamed protein product [Meloidogyne enterolobii]